MSIEDPKLSEFFLNHCTFRFATPKMLKKIGFIHLFHVQLLCLQCRKETERHHSILLSGDLHATRQVKAEITRRLLSAIGK